MTQLFVKNMVCDRCIKVVKDELEHLGFSPDCVHLGEVTLPEELTPEDRERVRVGLERQGLQLIDGHSQKIIESIKTAIIEKVRWSKEPLSINLSDHLSEKLGLSYPHLSKLFSIHENFTIEQFVILQKIERVKELLVYGELTVDQIAHQLSYSSAQYLSNQFKKSTGLTPTQFRQNNSVRRKALDQLMAP